MKNTLISLITVGLFTIGTSITTLASPVQVEYQPIDHTIVSGTVPADMTTNNDLLTSTVGVNGVPLPGLGRSIDVQGSAQMLSTFSLTTVITGTGFNPGACVIKYVGAGGDGSVYDTNTVIFYTSNAIPAATNRLVYVNTFSTTNLAPYRKIKPLTVQNTSTNGLGTAGSTNSITVTVKPLIWH